MLRPKWCISVASNGFHNVCICAIHQNVKIQLLMNSLAIKFDYRNLIDEIVCDRKVIPACYVIVRNVHLKKIVKKYYIQRMAINRLHWNHHN